MTHSLPGIGNVTALEIKELKNENKIEVEPLTWIGWCAISCDTKARLSSPPSCCPSWPGVGDKTVPRADSGFAALPFCATCNFCSSSALAGDSVPDAHKVDTHPPIPRGFFFCLNSLRFRFSLRLLFFHLWMIMIGRWVCCLCARCLALALLSNPGREHEFRRVSVGAESNSPLIGWRRT